MQSLPLSRFHAMKFNHELVISYLSMWSIETNQEVGVEKWKGFVWFSFTLQLYSTEGTYRQYCERTQSWCLPSFFLHTALCCAAENSIYSTDLNHREAFSQKVAWIFKKCNFGAGLISDFKFVSCIHGTEERWWKVRSQ